MIVVASAASRARYWLTRETPDVDAGVEERLERDRRGELSGADQIARELIDLLMDWLEEVRRLEKIRNPIKGLVVDQDSAQQRLFRLDIVRSGTDRAGQVLRPACGLSNQRGPWMSVLTRKLWHSTRFVTASALRSAVVPQFTSCIERWERPVFS